MCTQRLCAPTPPTIGAAADLRFALVTFVCNSTRHSDSPADNAEAHLARALRFHRRLQRHASRNVRTVAIAHGYDGASLERLRRGGYDDVRDVSALVDPTKLMRPIGSLAASKAGKHWPRVMRRTTRVADPGGEAAIRAAHDVVSFKLAQKNASLKSLGGSYLGSGAFSAWAKYWELPRHADGGAHACGTLPLLAWNLSAAYDRVLVADVDRACLHEDPMPWMRRHADHYLIGANDLADDFSGSLSPAAPRRAYDGIDDSLLYLQPDPQIYDLLLESALTGSYIPFTGRARDVIETIMPTHLAFPPLPRHERRACVAHRAAATAGSAMRPAGKRGGVAGGDMGGSIGAQSADAVAVAPSGAVSPAPLDLSVAVPKPRLPPSTKRWWVIYRGEAAPRVLWPKRDDAENATDREKPAPPAGCKDSMGKACRGLSLGNGCARADVARGCALSCGTCPALATKRFALVVYICNGGNDHYGNPPTEQIARAVRLRRSLTRLHTRIATVAVVHGYDPISVSVLRESGWDVRDVTHVDATAIMKQIPHETAGYHWPRYRANVQTRLDNKCRAVHLMAWNLTEYDRIILSDLDLCMAEDPLPWLRRHAASHFVAFNEMAKLRGYRGVNCHLALLHPSALMARVVLDKARTASYIPYTRGAQDVLETLFPTQVTFSRLLMHCHAFSCLLMPSHAVSRLSHAFPHAGDLWLVATARACIQGGRRLRRVPLDYARIPQGG